MDKKRLFWLPVALGAVGLGFELVDMYTQHRKAQSIASNASNPQYLPTDVISNPNVGNLPSSDQAHQYADAAYSTFQTQGNLASGYTQNVFYSQINTESGWKTGQVGDSGTSFGLMQVQKAAASDCNNMGFRDYTPDALTDPSQMDQASLYFGLAYMYITWKRLGKPNDIHLVLVGYNGGVGAANDVRNGVQSTRAKNATAYAAKVMAGA